MKKLIGLSLIAFGIFLEITWLGICFGTVIIGILLLIFAPGILFFPFNFFLVLGLSVMRGQSYKNSYQFKYNEFNYKQQNYSNPQQTSSSKVDEYYKTLESTRGDSLESIKNNYRRLIKEYHYDSIASKDLPDEMVKFAQVKTQELNEAYNEIKKLF